jgi:putative ABC transport system ATP-binding protein
MNDHSASQNWLTTRDLQRHYHRAGQEIRAVDGVNLTLGQGEFVALVGASGSGKSTLLNLVAGLDTPTAGTIEIGGQRLDGYDRRELAHYRAKRVGMVFQSFNLLPHQTAYKNVELALYFNGTPKDQRRELVTGILQRLGLGERMDHRPADLSGGEQQRVAVARAIVKSPEVLFADEPTGNLDQENAAAIGSLLRELNQDGLTILMVTHDLNFARHHATRIVRMHYGRLLGEDGE